MNPLISAITRTARILRRSFHWIAQRLTRKAKIKLGLNPYGPVDRQVGLIRLERTDGTLIALIASYAIHGTALGGANTLISGDVPGIVAAYVGEDPRPHALCEWSCRKYRSYLLRLRGFPQRPHHGV